MSGSIPNPINASTTSGSDLALLLNDFFLAYGSNMKGLVRDPNLLAGGTWVDESLEVSDDVLRYMIYDGATDLEILRINKVSGSVTVGSIDGLLEINKSSDDAFGAVISLLKRRATGSAQTQAGDVIGEIDFKSVDNFVVDYIVSKIEVVSTDTVDASNQGSELRMMTTATGTAALVERMRIANDGDIGVGTSTPDEMLHIKKQGAVTSKIERETDDAIGPVVAIKKARISGNGQTLLNDSLGSTTWFGEEADGTEVPLAKVEAFATENTDTGLHGSKLIISTKDNTTDAYVEKITVDTNGVTIDGVVQNDTESKIAMAHGGITQNLFTIDSTVYAAFTAEFYATGISVDTRSTKYLVSAVHNGTDWDYEFTADGLKGTDEIFDLVFTNAAVFNVQYDNKLDQGSFASGSIYLKIKRFGV